MRLMRLWILMGLVAALILIPFAIWQEPIESWTRQALDSGPSRLGVFALVAGLLALDVVLPVPSSLVSTAAGALLGFTGGLAASLTGMTAGCLAGYLIGARAGATRLLKPDDLERLRAAQRRYGDWLLILFRPVPVLAEASVIFAGLGSIPGRRFFWLTLLSNLGISAVYAAGGAFAARENFLWVFAAAVGLPAVAMGVVRRVAG